MNRKLICWPVRRLSVWPGSLLHKQIILLQKRAIVDDLRDGAISIDEAEEKAAKLGIQLIHDPERKFEDPSLHPDNRIYWTLPMALAWITWGSVDRVIEQTDEWRSQATRYCDWPSYNPLNSNRLRRFRSQRGHCICVDQYRPAKVGDMFYANPDDHDLVESAWADLTARLRNGGLLSTGIDKRTDERKPLPDFLWQDLFISAKHPGVFETKELNGPQYSDIMVKREDVFDLWPPATQPDVDTASHEPVSSPQLQRRYTKPQVRKMYNARIDQLVSEGKRSSEQEDLAFVRTLIPRMDRPTLRVWRKNKVPEDWTKGGAPEGPRKTSPK